MEIDGQDLEGFAAVTTGPVSSSFGVWKKRYIVIMVTWAAFLSPASANIYFPAREFFPLGGEMLPLAFLYTEKCLSSGLCLNSMRTLRYFLDPQNNSDI